MLRRMGRRRREEEEGEGEDALGQFVHRQTVAIWLKSCCRGAFAYRTLAVERLVLDTATNSYFCQALFSPLDKFRSFEAVMSPKKLSSILRYNQEWTEPLVPVYDSGYEDWTEWFDVEEVHKFMHREDVMRFAIEDPNRFMLWWDGPEVFISGRIKGQSKSFVEKREAGTGSTPAEEDEAKDETREREAGTGSPPVCQNGENEKTRRITIDKAKITIEEW